MYLARRPHCTNLWSALRLFENLGLDLLILRLDFSFSRRRVWRWLPYELLCRVVWYKFTDVSEVLVAARGSHSSPWWWRQQAPLKRRQTTRLHRTTTEKTAIFDSLGIYYCVLTSWDMTFSRRWRCLLGQPWRWKHYVPPKRLYLLTSSHGVTIQKINIENKWHRSKQLSQWRMELKKVVVMKFHAFYGSRNFVIVFTRARQMSRPFSFLMSLLIIRPSSRPCVIFPNVLFLTGVNPPPNPQAGGPSLVKCPRLFI
jgi:hypothetical protein